ncbi:acyl-CoA dehydrogenase family protein [Oceanospirillum sediminis]|nr:acyl-CoA dehydrogenase family protein [Oceanospirillum sediminis]
MRRLAQKFARNTIRPVAFEYDDAETPPWPVLAQAAQQGLMSYRYPEQYGGSGIDSVLTACLVSEEFGWGCAGIGNNLLAGDTGVLPILLNGNSEQKSRYIPQFCDKKQVRTGAFALTEPNAGSDISAIRTTAVPDGNDYVINGEKTMITAAGIADLYIIFAQLEHAGITAFIVEADSTGLSIGGTYRKTGMRASQVGSIQLKNVRVPASNRLGEEGQGFYIAMRFFEYNRPVLAALAVGVARAAYEYALEYAQKRVQFGQPVISNQAISFMLADMATEIDAARLLVWRAASLVDKNLPANAQASMAKVYATDMAVKATNNAVQILGGMGVMRDHPVEKWARDAKVLQIVEGTGQIQRMIISQLVSTGKN